MEMPTTGALFARRYRIEAPLGAGGFGSVFRATRVEDDTQVALKVLATDRGGYEPRTRARHDREVALMSGVRSPYLVELLDHGESEDGLLFLVFELVPGRDLGQVLAEVDHLDDTTVEHVLVQLLQGLQHLHRLGLLHRDIKPDNVRVFERDGDPWRVKLLDFGIAKPTTLAPPAKITQTGALVGTPRYMSPEQLHHDPLGPSSDIYSLGMVAYEMLIGSSQMHGSSLGAQIARLAQSRALQLPNSHGARLRDVVHRMLALRPQDRFQSAAAVLGALGHPPDDAPAVAAAAVPRRPSTTIAPFILAGALMGIVAAAVIALRPSGTEDAATALPPALMKVSEPAPSPPPPTDTGVDADDADDAASASAEAPAPSRGCLATKPPKRPGSEFRRRDGLELLIAVPDGYRPHHPHPVVLLFHDRLATAGDLFHQGDFRTLSDAQDVVIISVRDRNQLTPWANHRAFDTADDALRRVGDDLCLDPRRVVAVGDGAGAELVDQLRCEGFPLAGIVTANHRTDRTACARPPIPHLHFAARQNRMLPVSGGDDCIGGRVPSLLAHQQAWLTTNTCEADPTVWEKDADYVCHAWKCEAPFAICEVDSGRGWPRQKRRRTIDFTECDGPPPQGVPMAELAWRFLADAQVQAPVRSKTAVPEGDAGARVP